MLCTYLDEDRRLGELLAVELYIDAMPAGVVRDEGGGIALLGVLAHVAADAAVVHDHLHVAVARALTVD